MSPCDVKLTTYTSLHPKRVASTSSGASTSTQNGLTKTTDQFFYPLNVNFTAFDPGFNSWQTTVDHSYERLFSPSPFMVASTIRSHQTACGYLVRTPGGTTGNGTNENQFCYDDTKGNTYWRRINAAYNSITYDREGGSLADGRGYPWGFPTADVQNVTGSFRLPGGRNGK